MFGSNIGGLLALRCGVEVLVHWYESLECGKAVWRGSDTPAVCPT